MQNPLSSERIRAFGHLLQSRGYDASDFDVEQEPDSALSTLFVQIGNVLKVRRRSTGEERLYAGGVDSAWADSVLTDLNNGHLLSAADASAGGIGGRVV